MTRTAWSMAFVGVLGLSVSMVAAQGAKPNDDDLALVKRAVAHNAAPTARPQAEEPSAERPASRSAEPRWFKVRVVDKVTGKKKVTVNMPLSSAGARGKPVTSRISCSLSVSRLTSASASPSSSFRCKASRRFASSWLSSMIFCISASIT